MNDDIRNAEELRAMFGANLRTLASTYPSISALCRELGINRTQFNRYLSGESFPRPDVLDRICRFFDVDARILLKQLDEITPPSWHPAAQTLTEFLNTGSERMRQTAFPPGFYTIAEDGVQTTLICAKRLPQCTLVRGYVSRAAMPGAPASDREIQGIAACADGQLYILASHRKGANSQIYLFEKDPGKEANQWQGTAIDLFAPQSQDNNPQHQIVMTYLGDDRTAILNAARRGNPQPEQAGTV